jgi:hypothetical protein
LDSSQRHVFHRKHQRFGCTLCQLRTIVFRQLGPPGYAKIVPLDEPHATNDAFFVLEGDDESEAGEVVGVDVCDELRVGLLDVCQGDDFGVDDLGVFTWVRLGSGDERRGEY